MNIVAIARNFALRFTMNRFPRLYWELRASDIDQKWGHDTHDHALMQSIIEKIQPRVILDIGCGTGRMFPVFVAAQIPEIVGQDVSHWALKQVKQRFPSSTITVTSTDLEALDYPRRHFDLIVSNRVLSAVPPSDISRVLGHLLPMTRYIYLNEFSNTDPGNESSTWFRHNYHTILDSLCEYHVELAGQLGSQHYELLAIDRIL